MDADTELLDCNFEETCIADTPVTCEVGEGEEAEAGQTLQLDTEEECANGLVEWEKQMGVNMSSFYNDNSSDSGGSGDTVVLPDAKDEDAEVCDSTLLQELHPEMEPLNASNKEKMTEIPCRYVLEHGKHSPAEGNMITKACLAWNNHSCTTSTGLNEINNDIIIKDEGNQGPLTMASSKNISSLKQNIDDGVWPLNIDHGDDDEIKNYPSDHLSRKTRRLIFATPELMPLQNSSQSTNLRKPVISSLEPELSMKQGKGCHVPAGNDMDYLNSQEPGEESQALALGMVDKLVWMNSIGLSQDPNLELESDINLIPLEKSINPGMKSIVQVAEANGSANGLTVFDWVDSQQAVEFHASKENNHPSKETQATYGPQVQKSKKVRHAFVQRRTKGSPPGVKAGKNNSKQQNKTGADLIGKEEKTRGIMKWQEVPEGSDVLGKNIHQLLHDRDEDKHASADNSAEQVAISPTNAETMLDYFENQDCPSKHKKLSPVEIDGGGQGEEENVPELAIAEEVEIGMGTQIAIEAIEIMRHGSCVHVASHAPTLNQSASLPSPPSSAQAAKNLIWGNRTRSSTTRSKRECSIANDFGKNIKQVSEQSEAKQEAKNCQVEEDINMGKPVRHSNKNATFQIQSSANIDETGKEEKKHSCVEQIRGRKSGNKSASKTMIQERSKPFLATTETLGNSGTFLMKDSTRRSARISALKPANCAPEEITRSTKSRNFADCGLEARLESGKTVDKCATAQSTEKRAALLFPVIPTVPIKERNRITGSIRKDRSQEPSLLPETPKQKVITPKELPFRVSRSGQRRQHLDIVKLSNASVPLATETPLTSSGRKRRKIEMMYVLFSHGLSSDIVKHQKKILMKLGGNVANNVSDCTHFVADKFVRTGNMLEAMASGKPVVTVLWLESCGMAGCYINDKPYILRDLKKEKELGFSMPTTIFAAQQRPLLQGMKVYVTRNAKPEAISSIVKAAGGEVTTRYSATCPCLVISCEEDRKLCAALLEKGVKVHSTELIFNGIVVYRLDLSKYILFSDHTGRRKAEHKKK